LMDGLHAIAAALHPGVFPESTGLRRIAMAVSERRR
jgi:hypothetical protein